MRLRPGTRFRTSVSLCLAGAFAMVWCAAGPRSATPKFYGDDPLQREPETQDASAAAEREIDLFWDLSYNLFARPGDPTPNVRAQNINTIDEVPDSSWFTNRIVASPLAAAEVARGPLVGEGPRPGTLTVIRQKSSGAAPGFTVADTAGDMWFVSFDARGYPEAATGAMLVANKLFWALGYHQVENHLTRIRPEQIEIREGARWRPPSGRVRPMDRGDIDSVFARAQQSPDGSYRAVAARAIPGRVIGGFEFFGTRPDDPNDIVPHEHRRELRALKVFGAWTNLVDMKAGNTLDTVLQENGKGIIRHYLQDVGSTFGTGATGPRDWDEGWEYLFEGGKTLARLVSLGLVFEPWHTAKYDEHDAVGRFEGEAFDPERWKPRVPTAAYLHARADDDFWAARRVMAFSDEMIRAAASSAGYTDPRAVEHLVTVLVQRRDKIGRAYLAAVNPLVDFALDENALRFTNAAVQHGVAEPPSRGYSATWFRFDNATGEARPIGQPTTGASGSLPVPRDLPSRPGEFVKVQVVADGSPHAPWARPVDVYFTRIQGGWKLVGLERAAPSARAGGAFGERALP